jgi:hypothetical protein
MSIEDRIRQASDALEAEINAALAGKLKTLSDEIAAAAAQERVAAEAEAMARLADDLATAREEAERFRQASVAEARAEVEHRFGIELQRARADAETLSMQASKLREELDAARSESNRHQETATRLDQQIAQLSQESTQLKEERNRVGEEFDKFRGEFERLRQDADRIQDEFKRAHADLARLGSEAGNLRQERDRLAQEAAASVERQAAEREATIAGFERLATTFRRIDAAASLTEILGALAPAAAAETARVALLVASPAVGGSAGNFKPWGIYGFPAPPEGFELPVTSAEDLSRTGLPFAPLRASRAGLALPIQVGGQTVAMLYADDGEAEHQTPAPWPEAIELLARHAATRMEALIALRTVQAVGIRTGGATAGDEPSARRYAKLLISEIKMYNEAPVRLGVQHRDLCERLRPEIDRARRHFEERVPASSGARHVFDEELIQTLAGGDPSVLGIAQAGSTSR